MDLIDRMKHALRKWLDMPQWLSALSYTPAGVAVSEATATRCITVVACAKLLAEVGASLPLDVVEVQGDHRRNLSDHPLLVLLNREPNPDMSAWDWRVQQWMSLALWGNAYSRIMRTSRGVIALWPLDPATVSVRVEPGGVSYEVPGRGGSRETLPAREILHVRLWSRDGIRGESPVAQMRNAIGSSLAMSDYTAAFFSQGARPDLVLEVPGRLSETARREIIESWRARHEGSGRAHRVALIEGGMQVKTLQMPHDDMQFLESRRFERSEIISWFRIPPHLVSDVTGSTSWGTGIEQQVLGFLKFTLQPWLVAWEKQLERSLLNREERARMQIRHNVAALERADLNARINALTKAIMTGIMSPNEARQLEDRNPYPGGERFRMQMQMVPVDTLSSDSSE